MKSDHIKPEVLARYLSGDCTAAEKKRVEQWIQRDSGNRKIAEQYKQIWDLSSSSFTSSKNPFETSEEWAAITRKMEAEPKKAKNQYNNYEEAAHKTGRSTFLRVAAVFLIAAMIGIFAYQNWIPAEDSESEPALRQITTEMGQRVNLTLSDGTKVLVNANSEMKLPEVFDQNKREVFLKGQAYFNVASNSEKPFIIHSGETTTRVLGTSFSISAYPEDGQITIAVREGRVSFQPNGNSNNAGTILKEYELGRYDLNTRQVDTRQIDDMELYTGWINGYLKFREAPMVQVARELERRYGVTVTFAGEDIKHRSLTALLKSRSIRNVLDVISMSLDIGYKIDGDHVVFQKS